MSPARIAHVLITAGIALYLYWFFAAPNPSGMSFAIGGMLGAAAFHYNGRPRPIPLFLGLLGILFALQLLSGTPLNFALGAVLGAGLPYLAYRLKG